MSIFIALATFSLAFMLYALLQFVRESKRTNSRHWQSTKSKVRVMQAGRLITMISKPSRQGRSPRSAHRRVELR
jgi:hypothetical protein